MDEEAKRAFNMKVLKRHDASITEILASASFVVLYSHNEQWVRRDVRKDVSVITVAEGSAM